VGKVKLILILPFLLTSCINLETTGVMLSKGEAGFLQSIFGADISYCKLEKSTDSEDFSEEEIAIFEEFCKSDIMKLTNKQ